MNRQSDCQCYSVRELNPFSGVVQIVRTGEGHASSRDGIDWQIEILTSNPTDTWSGSTAAHGKQISIKFGQWSAHKGLRNIPANPILNLTQMLSDTQRLIALLQAHAAQVPFPSIDRAELWLLDDERRQPLALLASSVHVPDSPAIRTDTAWQAARGALGDQDALRDLETAVNFRARSGYCRWITRNTQIETGTTRVENPTLGQPPPLLLNECWADEKTQRLVDDYHHWLAPYLLTLQHLSDETRSRLELSAVKRCQSLNSVWRLYPRIINQREIDAARVEARLRAG
jgi:hypothetical protein